jgi:hypothetical protein
VDATVPAGSPHRPAAGAVLLVLGGLWFAVGAVLLVLAWLYGRGPESIPANLDFDPALVSAAPRSVGLGLMMLAAGVGQMAAGFGVVRGASGWASRGGALLAAGGAGLVGWWLVSGLAEARPMLILVPALAAYLYAAAALSLGGRAPAR